MLLNAATFPIVRLSYDQGLAGTADEAFAAFEALLDRGTPFVIIGQGANGDVDEHERALAMRNVGEGLGLLDHGVRPARSVGDATVVNPVLPVDVHHNRRACGDESRSGE